MNLTHDDLLKLTRALALDVAKPEDEPGLCHGFTAALMSAIVQGKSARETFFKRLQCIDYYRSDVDKLIDAISLVKAKVRSHQELTEAENELLEIPAFLQTVLIHHSPENYHTVLNARLEQFDFLDLLAFTGSLAIEKSLPIREIAQAALAVNLEELKQYLIKLEGQICQCENVAIQIGCDNHTVGLTYDSEPKRWVYCDINNLENTENGYQVLDAASLSQAVFDSFDDESHSLFTIQFYSAKPYPQEEIIKSICRLQLEQLSNEALKRRNVRGENLFYLVSRAGLVDVTNKLLLNQDVIAGKYKAQLQHALYTACEHGNLSVVKALLGNKDVDANTIVKGYGTALQAACGSGHSQVAQYLVQHSSADINLADNNGETALYLACENGHIETVKCLLQQPEIDINHSDIYGQTALFAASMRGHTRIVKLLLDNKAINLYAKDHRNRDALHIACNNGHANIVELLLDKEQQQSIDSDDSYYSLITGYMRWTGKKVFGWYQFDINANNSRGESAFDVACKYGHEAVIDLLSKRGEFDPNHINARGNFPLYVAAKKGHHKVVKKLLSMAKLDSQAMNARGRTAMYAACKHGHLKAVKLLLQHRKKMNHGTALDPSMLFVAAKYGHAKILKTLLEYTKLDVNYRNAKGHSLLYEACKYGHSRVVNLLLSWPGIQANQRHRYGKTALYTASAQGHRKIIRLLLAHPDIDADIANNKGLSPLKVAKRNGYEKSARTIARFLKPPNQYEVNFFNFCNDIVSADEVNSVRATKT